MHADDRTLFVEGHENDTRGKEKKKTTSETGNRPPSTAEDILVETEEEAYTYRVDECSRNDISYIAEEYRWCYNAFKGKDTCFKEGFTFKKIHDSDKAIEYARENGLALFAYDMTAKFSKSYVVCNYRALYEAMILMYGVTKDARELQADGKINNFYEGFLIERPVTPYLDMEFDVEYNEDKVEKADEMTIEAIKLFSVYLERFFDGNDAIKDIKVEDWIILDSSNHKKISRHAILRKKGVYFDTLLDHAMFSSVVLQDFNYRSGKGEELFKSLTVKRVVGGEAKGRTVEFVNFMDLCVYKEFQLFRCIKCHKFGQDRVLEVAKANRFRLPAYATRNSTRIMYEFFLLSLPGAVQKRHLWKKDESDPSKMILVKKDVGLKVKVDLSQILLVGYAAFKRHKGEKVNVAITPDDDERRTELEKENKKISTKTTNNPSSSGRGRRKTSSSSSSSSSSTNSTKKKKNTFGEIGGNNHDEENEEDEIEEINDGDGEEKRIMKRYENKYLTILSGMPGVDAKAIERSMVMNQENNYMALYNRVLPPNEYETIKSTLVDFIVTCNSLREWTSTSKNYEIKCRTTYNSIVPEFYTLIPDSLWCPIAGRIHTHARAKTYAVFMRWGVVKIKCLSASCYKKDKIINEKMDKTMIRFLWDRIEEMEREEDEKKKKEKLDESERLYRDEQLAWIREVKEARNDDDAIEGDVDVVIEVAEKEDRKMKKRKNKECAQEKKKRRLDKGKEKIVHDAEKENTPDDNDDYDDSFSFMY